MRSWDLNRHLRKDGQAQVKRKTKISGTVQIKSGKRSEVTQWKNEKGNLITVVENDFWRAVGNKVKIVWDIVKFRPWIFSINLSKLFWSQFTCLPDIISQCDKVYKISFQTITDRNVKFLFLAVKLFLLGKTN